MAAQKIRANVTQTDAESLECKSQSHCNGPVAILCGDLPKSRRRNAVAWRTRDRVVQDVVELGAELQPHALADGLPSAHNGIPTDRSGVAQIRFRARAVA